MSRKASQKAQKSIIFVQRYRFKTYHSCHFLVNFRHVQLFFGLNTFIFHQLYKKLNSQLSLIKTRLKLSLVFSNRLGYIEGNFGLAIYFMLAVLEIAVLQVADLKVAVLQGSCYKG